PRSEGGHHHWSDRLGAFDEPSEVMFCTPFSGAPKGSAGVIPALPFGAPLNGVQTTDYGLRTTDYGIMNSTLFDELQQTLAQRGGEAAIELLCTVLRENKEYDRLFYALLMKKRHELGVYPVPTDGTQFLPEAVQKPYEEAIREAGQRVGR